MDTDRLFTRDSLPDGEYLRFRKTYSPVAIRMSGPFSCMTSEGNIASCADGWLAVDSRGHPYPVNAEEFTATYEIVDNDQDRADGA